MSSDTDKHVRPPWDEYFMGVMESISRRATCARGRSGCVIARGNQILVAGYVGSPVGAPHCDDVGHLMRLVKTIKTTDMSMEETTSEHCVRTVHAEQNAICQAAKLGVSVAGGTLYCRMTPCRTCAMMIINCGIVRVICQKKYHKAEESIELFRQSGVWLEHQSDDEQEYEG
jgi:dCMP deaminase